jgi:D-glycero-alpha-D-manno-heptose-7-phosphate kinase
MLSVCVSAPARVDLAGGTLDLWPLYLFHAPAATVNVAIDRRARVRASRITAGFEIFARDRGTEQRFGSASEARSSTGAAIAAEAAIALGMGDGVRVETESAVPFGSGLGGSSALLVAAVSALAALAGAELDLDRAIALCRDVETTVLGRPAGTQDYVPALRGGFQVIDYGPGARSIRRIPADAERFGRSLVLFDSGRPHSSGLNNWEIYKARIDGDRTVAGLLDGIRDAAEEMAAALDAGDLEAMGRALGREWSFRKRLSPRVSTPLLEEAERRAVEAGAWGARACGAGGGGVMVVLGPEAARERISTALSAIPGGALFAAAPDPAGARREF